MRLIDEDGSQVGVKEIKEALDYAHSKDLDLVEVASGADPPVARIMDYGKYRYEQEQKAKLARKHQSQINVKEIKLRPKIGQHDYETKKGHVVRFLNQRAKVKVTIMFRGRDPPGRRRDRETADFDERRRWILLLVLVRLVRQSRVADPAGAAHRDDHSRQLFPRDSPRHLSARDRRAVGL